VARYVAAGDPVEFLIVPRQVIVGLVSRDGSFARAMSSMCAQRLRSVTARLSAQISRSTISRLASALMPYSVPGSGLVPACSPLLNMNQAQLAIAAGTVKTVANRELSRLEEAGAIERKRGRVVRIDRAKLSTFL
jgi:CRP-like cAMP-binding protein